MAEPEAEPEGEPEPVPEGKAEGERINGYQWLQGAPTAEGEEIMDKFDTGILFRIIMPTVGLFVFLISGLMIHSFLNQRAWWRKFWYRCSIFKKKPQPDILSLQGGEQLLTTADCTVLEAYTKFPNRPSDLLKLLLPALISLTGSPTLLMLKNVINKFFFPNAYMQPNVNDILYCFLIPAGMLYATVFGFSLQICVMRFHNIVNFVNLHYLALRNCMASIVHDSQMSSVRKVKLMRNLKDEIVILMQVFMNTWDFQTRGIQEKKPINFSKGIYSFMLEIYGFNPPVGNSYENLVEIAGEDQEEAAQQDVFSLNKDELEQYMDMLREIVDCRWNITIQSQNASMNTVQWLFLECLAYTSYFGILMLVASSALLELVMCTVTVMSISMFSYILSDISSPLHGFFRVHYTSHMELLQRMQLMATKHPDQWGYIMDLNQNIPAENTDIEQTLL